MKILIVSSGYPDADYPFSHIFVHMQVKALLAAGADAAVLNIDMRSIRKKRRWGFYCRQYEGVAVYTIALPCGPINGILEFLSQKSAGYAFKRIVKLFGLPDVIHAHFGYTASYLTGIKKKFNVPFVITEHFSGMLKRNRTKKIEKQAKKAYETSDFLIAVGNGLRSSMKDVTEKEIEVVPNILPSYFSVKDYVKIPNFTYISIGNLIESKRFDLTIKAFADIYKNRPDVRLKIIGTGPLLLQLSALARECGCENAVHFAGAVKNESLPNIYSSCSCFVLPSEFETFGIVYAEAIACGLPVIATKCGGPEDFVNTSNGILIPKDDLKALHKAMEYMYNNASNYNKEEISKEILLKTSEQTIASRLLEIYRQQLKN